MAHGMSGKLCLPFASLAFSTLSLSAFFFFHSLAFGHAVALVHLVSVQGFKPLLCSFCVVV